MEDWEVRHVGREYCPRLWNNDSSWKVSVSRSNLYKKHGRSSTLVLIVVRLGYFD